YELTGLLGEFTEYDLDADHALVPVDRPKGHNSAAMVAGMVTTPNRNEPKIRCSPAHSDIAPPSSATHTATS
ncbi:hypothetical protein, partial [Nocardia wallacei]|uniref:hypothetical protein n=1 Tax=Nocardia wallacei TaxID=480035 RepID=UPI002456E40F